MTSPNSEEWILFGASGLLGHDFAQELVKKNIAFSSPNRHDFSISADRHDLVTLISKASTVVNCIAYTNVDKAESETELAFATNYRWPRNLAEACKEVGSHLIHISTDYVFSGDTDQPYLPSDQTNPINVYGKSKVEGEEAVIDSGAKFSIFRTAWLYGEGGPCFPARIRSRLRLHEKLSIVSDQFGSPTWTRDVANLIISHVEQGFLPRIVHATSGGICSWYEFAVEIAESLGCDSSLIEAVASYQFDTPARRPRFGALDREDNPIGLIGHWRERWLEASQLFRQESK